MERVFLGTLRTRADKATDSPYDFFNWLTLGITGDTPVGIYEAAKDRSEHMFDSKEKFADWLTLGTVEMAKGAFNPDEAWSADHWLNSLGMVTLLYGPVEKSLLPTGSGGLKPPKGLDSVKDFEVKKPLPAFSTNEGFQFKINNLDVDTPALPQTPMQINFKNEMDRILREKMEGKSESNHSIKDVEVKAVEGTGDVGTPPRYGDRQISQEEYDMLRDQTPTRELRDKVNEGHDKKAVTQDEVLPGKTFKGALEADHIVSMDRITRMDGFGKLTEAQKLEVLNNPDNFIGLSKSANTSKQSKSFEEWTHYKKGKSGEIEVNPEFREKMMVKEKELERKIQKQIDDFNKSNGKNKGDD